MLIGDQPAVATNGTSRLWAREGSRNPLARSTVIGHGRAITRVLTQAEHVARTDSTVLLLGETGTGKELLARVIHDRSARRERPMVKVNCAALPATLVESELFGRERGAYTGALTRQAGRFEVADGSTLLLDEVAELPLELQAKLLRVLEDGEFERLGSSRSITVDVRLIAATNRDLIAAIRKGLFREDLYYRLNVFPITIPPLRERVEDIPQLVWTFVGEFSEAMGKVIDTIPDDRMDALRRYPWPGNVRELRNVIERAMILARDGVLAVELPQQVGGGTLATTALADVERHHIVAVLERTAWRVRGVGGAAALLRLKPTTLEARMKKLGILRPDRRRHAS
jgi:transcriptional regulator with GAF, ATPase, and Fis domain